MPTATHTELKVSGEDISLKLDVQAIVSAGKLEVDCSAKAADIFADFSGKTLAEGSVVNFVMQPHSHAQIFLKLEDSSGALDCSFSMAEGSEANIFAHAENSDLRLRFSADVQRHATARFFGLTQTEKTEHTDIIVDVHHLQGENLTEQKFYSFAADSSTISFTGKITVDSGASGAVAHQLHRGTALSPTARIDAKPFLNIRHDDVKCTHGSTVGFIDETARHYLMARGLAKDEAENMLIRSSEQQFYGALPEGDAHKFFGYEAAAI